jgi:hypothetical protein
MAECSLRSIADRSGRRGVLDTQFAEQATGALRKPLNRVSHKRLAGAAGVHHGDIGFKGLRAVACCLGVNGDGSA